MLKDSWMIIRWTDLKGFFHIFHQIFSLFQCNLVRSNRSNGPDWRLGCTGWVAKPSMTLCDRQRQGPKTRRGADRQTSWVLTWFNCLLLSNILVFNRSTQLTFICVLCAFYLIGVEIFLGNGQFVSRAGTWKRERRQSELQGFVAQLVIYLKVFGLPEKKLGKGTLRWGVPESKKESTTSESRLLRFPLFCSQNPGLCLADSHGTMVSCEVQILWCIKLLCWRWVWQLSSLPWRSERTYFVSKSRSPEDLVETKWA